MFGPCCLSLNLNFCHAMCGKWKFCTSYTHTSVWFKLFFLCLRRLNQSKPPNGKSRKWMNNNNKMKISTTPQGRKMLHSTMQSHAKPMPCIASANMQPINVHACPPHEVANMVSYSEDTWRLKQADTSLLGDDRDEDCRGKQDDKRNYSNLYK